MKVDDIISLIPDDDLASIKEYSNKLTEVCPFDVNGERIDWFAIRVEDWWREKKYTIKYGYHISFDSGELAK